MDNSTVKFKFSDSVINEDSFINIYKFLTDKEIALSRKVCKEFRRVLNKDERVEYILSERKVILSKADLSYLKSTKDPYLTINTIFRNICYFREGTFCNTAAKFDSQISFFPEKNIHVQRFNFKKLASHDLFRSMDVGNPIFIGNNMFIIPTENGSIFLMTYEKDKISICNSVLLKNDIMSPLTIHSLGNNFFLVNHAGKKNISILNVDMEKKELLTCSTLSGRSSFFEFCNLGDNFFAVFFDGKIQFLKYDMNGDITEGFDAKIEKCRNFFRLNDDHLFCHKPHEQKAYIYKFNIKTCETICVSSFDTDQESFVLLKDNVVLGKKETAISSFLIDKDYKKLTCIDTENESDEMIFMGSAGDPVKLSDDLVIYPYSFGLSLNKYENGKMRETDQMSIPGMYPLDVKWIGNNLVLISNKSKIILIEYSAQGKVSQLEKLERTGIQSKIEYLGQGRFCFVLEESIEIYQVEGTKIKLEEKVSEVKKEVISKPVGDDCIVM